MLPPRTYRDIHPRESSLDASETRGLLALLPPAVRDGLIRCYLDSDARSTEELTGYFVRHSAIFRCMNGAPGSAVGFEPLYTRQVSTPVDQYFIECKAGAQIFQRLLALEAHLPRWIDRQLMGKPSVLVDNIGSGTGRDVIAVLGNRRDLAGRVKVRNIDPDAESLRISEALARDEGIASSFSFCRGRLGEVPPASADLVLLIGILCPLHRRASKAVLRKAGPYLRDGGLAIFSTAMDTMLVDDPFTDFLMRLSGWHMAYRSEEESEALAKALGWRVVEKFFDEPRRHHCMVVAERS